MTHHDETGGEPSVERGADPRRRTIDWLISLVLVLAGSTFAYGGALIYRAADLEWITTWVVEGRITSDVLTPAELVDVTYALLWGGGLGLAVIGVLMAATGVGFLVVRTRARRRVEATGGVTADAPTNAIIGAVVTVALSFVPFAPVLGGAVAGYLQRDAGNGVRTGAMVGMVTAVPVVVLFAIIIGSLIVAVPGVTSLVAIGLALALLMSMAYLVGLSALGGYLGTVLAEDRTRRPA